MVDGPTAIDVLIKNDALLVHCAGYAKMVGNAHTNQLGYLERLQVAAEGDLELACSTVREGDWTSIAEIRNYTGPCGLVLRPIGENAITYAWHKDAGTSIGENGRRAGISADALVFPLDRAISCRAADTYNEVGVLGYEVLGIFMDRLQFEYSIPDCQVADRLTAFGNPGPEHTNYAKAFMEEITLNDVCKTFPDLDIFLLRCGQLNWIRQKGLATSGPVTLNYVYGR